MKQPVCIEALELRQLLSVSGATLAGPITIGSQWTYQSTQGKVIGNSTTKIVGTSTINGIKTIERDTTSTTTSTPGTSISKLYFTVTSSKGVVEYKGTTNVVIGKTDFSTTSTYTPYETIFPASIKGGQTLTFTWTTKNVGNLTGTNTSTNKLQITLPSETLQTVTTPAGKFKAYLLDNTLTTTTLGKTVSSSFQEWVAPGVGIVKEVAGSGTGTATTVLTSYKIK